MMFKPTFLGFFRHTVVILFYQCTINIRFSQTKLAHGLWVY